MAKLDDQLKKAITKMSAAEKDKLLLRLIAKDDKLVHRLIFELLEGGSTRDERAEKLKNDLIKGLKQSSEYAYYSPGYLLLDLRYWNARISEHVQATKDKLGEVSLTLFMLAEGFRINQEMLRRYPEGRSLTFAPYVIKRTLSILQKAEKLHEDYHLEFRQDGKELIRDIWAFSPTARLAGLSHLPEDWPF